MTEIRRALVPTEEFASREAALFVAQLDDQSRRLREDTRGLTRDELEWQPARGLNTIGMLLAHIALVEVYWVYVAAEGTREGLDCRPLLGIGIEDDGMPMPEHGQPPATMSGRPLDFFDDLLARARAYTKRRVAEFGDDDLGRFVTVEPRWVKGSTYVMETRWILYHLVEHLAGHYGQVNLIAHQYRSASPTTARGGAGGGAE